MKLREYKTKNNNFIQRFLLQSPPRVHDSTMMHACGAADIERPSLLVHRLYILVQISKAGQKISV